MLYTLAESLRIIAILISPVLPKAAHGIFDQLNWKMELSGKEERFSLADAEWGDCRMDMWSASQRRYSRGSRLPVARVSRAGERVLAIANFVSIAGDYQMAL